MAYSFYMDGVLLPVTPETLQLKIKGRNETVTLMDQGEVNVLKSPGLTEVSFDALLPNVRYPFAEYPGGFRKAEYYLTLFERLKLSGVFQLVVSRRMPGGNRPARQQPESFNRRLRNKGRCGTVWDGCDGVR